MQSRATIEVIEWEVSSPVFAANAAIRSGVIGMNCAEGGSCALALARSRRKRFQPSSENVWA